MKKKHAMHKRSDKKKNFKNTHRSTTKGKKIPLSHRSDGY